MLYTIGYSDRSLPQFLHELERRAITRIVDVRTSPWSRNAVFNASQIEQWAERAGIHYRQEGRVLGGRTEVPLDHPDYLAALYRLLEAACREALVIMCAEGRPEDCHRTWDVGASLLVRHGVVARSILRDGQEEYITETIRRVPASRLAPEMREMIDPQRGLF